MQQLYSFKDNSMNLFKKIILILKTFFFHKIDRFVMNADGRFVVPVTAYLEFIRFNNLDDIESLRRGGLQARQFLKNGRSWS